MREEMWYNSSNRINNERASVSSTDAPFVQRKGKFRMASSDHTPVQLPLPIDEIVEIPLRVDVFTIVDVIDADLKAARWHLNYMKNGRVRYAKCFYYEGRDKQGRGSLHRLILERMLGRSLETHEQVDHIDGDGLNNRRSNLRLATRADNQRNKKRPRNNTSGYKGVVKSRQRWRAQIYVADKGIHLGTFDTPEEAHDAYCKAARELFGEFACFD